jgi:hypothetical protein
MLKNLIYATILGLVLGGCSSNSNPIAPVSPAGENIKALTGESQTSQGQRQLWGYWEWVIDTQAGTIEVAPLRSAEMHFNVSKFVDGPPAKLAITNYAADKPNGTVDVDVALTHIFPGRPSLTGFDVHGILICPGSKAIWSDPSVIMPGPTDPKLLNPDGLTRWWNPNEFNIGNDIFSYRDGNAGVKNSIGKYTATINGYKTFADDLDINEPVSQLNVVKRVVFSSGETNSRHYKIWFPVKNNYFVFKFNYAVDACWAKIPGYQQGDPVNVPADFLPEANQPEPFRVQDISDPSENSLWYVSNSERGGTGIFKLRVYDWQGLLTDGDVADQINSLKFESPDCLNKVFTATVIDPGSDSSAYADYQVIVSGSDLVNCDGSGPLDVLLTVQSAFGNYQSSQTGYKGTALLATYAFTTMSVGCIPPTGNKDPIADATSDVTDIFVGQSVHFDASGSSDPDGFIVPPYQWDFNGDGTFGDTFDSGNSLFPVKQFNTAGIFNVNLRITDDEGATDTLDTPITITVSEIPEDLPPVAVATSDITEVFSGSKVKFDGTGSSDPDGTISDWSWDFGSGVYGKNYDSGTDQKPEKIFTGEPGDKFDVDLRVTDDDGLTDTLDQKITIHIVEPDNLPPVAVANVVGTEFWEDDLIEFNATGSYDPDGTVTEWHWDFDNDGIFDEPVDDSYTGPQDNPTRAFISGDHTVNLKVIDNGGKSDTLDQPVDERITFHVESHVVIELSEDHAYKAVNGYKYQVLMCDDPSMIPVDYTTKHGPWDFTTPVYLPDPDYVRILPIDDPEVVDYVPSFFPSETDYFIKYEFQSAGIDGELYLAEEPDYVNNVLTLYGHIERKEGSTKVGLVSYDAETGGPILLPYPWKLSTNASWTINYTGGSSGFLTLEYHEVGLGEGWTTVPFDGILDTRALLTRASYNVKLGNKIVLQGVLYKWTADDGRQLARLYSTNSATETNFNQYTFEITGTSTLDVIQEVL